MRVHGLLLAVSLVSSAASTQPPNGERASERELLKRMVEIQTVEGRTSEFRKMTALLRAELRMAGVTDVIIKDHEDTQTLIARWRATRPSGKKPILVMAHMDVVEAEAADWKNPPFELRENDGFYLGRGTSDMKGKLAGLVLALQNLKRSGFQPTRDLIILVTGDEESGLMGARRASTEWRSLTDAEFALNLDMGGGALFADGRADHFRIQVAEKTYADFKLLALNRGGHSAGPRPDNAIYALAGALKAIEAYRFEPMINEATRGFLEHIAAQDQGRYGELVRRFLANPKNREEADLLEANSPGTTRTRCVATMISSGHAPNALAQRAEANVNCRIFPGVTVDVVKEQLRALAGDDVTVTEGRTTPGATPSPLRHDVLEAFRAAVSMRFPGASILPSQTTAASDGSFFRATGMPVYGVGSSWEIVGQSSGAHGLDEQLLIEAFHGQVPIIEQLLRRLAG